MIKKCLIRSTICQWACNFVFALAVITLVVAQLMAVGPVSAATYYIDYETGSDANDSTSKDTPWKRCPGMTGFSGSYLHSVGDVFVFKGGVTWPTGVLPLSVSHSGTEGNIDTYRSDESWYNGASYTKPTFDAEGILTVASPLVSIINRSYIRVSGLRFINGGVSGGNDGGYTIKITSSSYIEIDNCRLQPFSHHGIVGSYASGTHASVKIHDCEFSDLANFIEFGLTYGNLNGLEIYNNIFRDPWSMAVNYDHIDGIHCFRASGTGVITNLKIHNNFFTGNWGGRDENTGGTSMIYLEHNGQVSPLIYNNVLSYKIENSPNSIFFRSLIFLSGGQGAKIFNNTIFGRNVYNDMSCGIDIYYGSKDVEIKNNIVAGIKNCIRIGPNSTVSGINNNILWPVPGTSVGIVGTDFCSWNRWNNTYGYDQNRVNANPLFVSEIYPYDLSLQNSSPAKDIGADLSGYFTVDFLGCHRPKGNGWDIGAYEYFDGPTSLRILNISP